MKYLFLILSSWALSYCNKTCQAQFKGVNINGPALPRKESQGVQTCVCVCAHCLFVLVNKQLDRTIFSHLFEFITFLGQQSNSYSQTRRIIHDWGLAPLFAKHPFSESDEKELREEAKWLRNYLDMFTATCSRSYANIITERLNLWASEDFNAMQEFFMLSFVN